MWEFRYFFGFPGRPGRSWHIELQKCLEFSPSLLFLLPTWVSSHTKLLPLSYLASFSPHFGLSLAIITMLGLFTRDSASFHNLHVLLQFMAVIHLSVSPNSLLTRFAKTIQHTLCLNLTFPIKSSAVSPYIHVFLIRSGSLSYNTI